MKVWRTYEDKMLDFVVDRPLFAARVLAGGVILLVLLLLVVFAR